MHIPIKNAYLLYTELLLCISCCNCHIVKETEASYVHTGCVVAWGSHNTKSRVDFVIHYSTHSFNGATSSQKGRSGSVSIFISVILESSRVLTPNQQLVLLHPRALWIVHVYRILNFLHMRVRMNLFKMLVFCW